MSQLPGKVLDVFRTLRNQPKTLWKKLLRKARLRCIPIRKVCVNPDWFSNFQSATSWSENRKLILPEKHEKSFPDLSSGVPIHTNAMRSSGTWTGGQLPISAKIPSFFQLFRQFLLPPLEKDNFRLYSSFLPLVASLSYKMHSLSNFFNYFK